jgi:prepilin-type N-terminal cleavage/methylation domain-containing protein
MRPPVRRPGFTLIELLLVMAVIGILAAAILPLASGALNSQRKARATGHIRAIAGACDAYRKLYGDFPLVRPGSYTTLTTDYPNFRQDLFAQLTGTKVLFSTVTTTGAPSLRLVDHNDPLLPNGAKRAVRPLLTTSIVTACDATGDEDVDADQLREFIDPWGNAYDYRYRVACAANEATNNTGANRYGYWFSPEFLLVSCGREFVASTSGTTPHVPLMNEYWHASLPSSPSASSFAMTTRGTISSAYFEDGAGYSRSDNLTNWSGR